MPFYAGIDAENYMCNDMQTISIESGPRVIFGLSQQRVPRPGPRQPLTITGQ